MRYNNNFGDVIENIMYYAPKPIVIDGIKHYTNSAELHRKAGFLPVEHHDFPKDGKEYRQVWVLDNDVWVETWVEVT